MSVSLSLFRCPKFVGAARMRRAEEGRGPAPAPAPGTVKLIEELEEVEAVDGGLVFMRVRRGAAVPGRVRSIVID